MNTMKSPFFKILPLLLFVVFIQSDIYLACAQKSRQPSISPTMKISNLAANEENPMHLNALKIDIKVIGQIAVTTLDMTYYNNNNRILEGEFNFPLGEGQTVSRFALDINGTLREGVVVEKEHGRKTFEAIVRRGVDPGLLEMTEGNNFRARVYPLPAKGSRRIVISYEQELLTNEQNDLFLLPLNISEPVSKFSLHAEVVKNQVSFDNDNNELNNVPIKKWDDSYVTDFVQDNYTPNKQIAFAFPHTIDSAKVYTALKIADSSYFFITINPKLISKEKTLPKRITVLWDNSNSAQNRDIEKELTVLGKYIETIGNLSIELVPFNIEPEKATIYEIKNGNWNELKTQLSSLVYDGGTSLGNIDFLKFKSDEILMFTDGLSTFGKSEPRYSNIPIITINSSLTANHAGLTFMSQQSGGMYINLSKLRTTEANALLSKNNYQFISAKPVSGNISCTYPSTPCQFQNSFSMAGIVNGKSATIMLNFGFGTNIVYTRKIEITTDNSAEKVLLQRLWAEKKLAELSYNTETNKDKITRIGKEFGIVTQNTSLIVLETLNDYLQYKIVPPKDLQEAYFNQIAVIQKSEKDKLNVHLDYVASLSDEQSKWWNTSFPIQTEKPKTYNKSGSNQTRFIPPVTVDSTYEEVVIVGNGAQLRSDVTGSTSESNSVTSVASSSASSVSARASTSSSQNQSNRRQDHLLMELDNNSPNDAMLSISNEPNESAVAEEMIVEEPAFISNNEAASSRQSDKHSGDIQINAWVPQTPYLKVLQYTTAGQEYNTYLKLKGEYGTTPAFYIDAADYFAKIGKTDTAVKIISNLAELKLESPQLLRILGKKLTVYKKYSDAIVTFEKVLKLKGEEPQSYRDMALAYADGGNPQKAIITYYEAIKKEWDSRFPAIELILLNELNSIIAKNPKLDYSFVDKRLIKKESVDIRVVLSWDTDNCDMDLWVTDPSGEKCFYSNKNTRLGGKITNDFTGGYGPEEFMIKKAMAGEFFVQANYFGTRSQSLLAPVNLNLTFLTNFGKANEMKKEVNIRLENQKDIIDIGWFKF